MSLSPLSHHVRFARPLLAVALGASLTFASACGSDSPTGPTNVPGTYVRRSIDGTPLPFAVQEERDHDIGVNTVTAPARDNTHN